MTGMISLDTYHGSTVSIIWEKSMLKHRAQNVSTVLLKLLRY